jgi:4-hydroxybenzoate polyprenyltransferase
MLKYLNLIRYKNILFLAFIQIMMREFILFPILQKYGFEITSNDVNFIILILATAFIAAGGYVLNDYFDIKIDQINRPERQIVNVSVSKKNAMLIYQAFTVVGTLLGLILAFLVRNFNMALIFIAVPGLLWFYSASYKRQFIVGNIIVAILAALSLMIVAFTELAQLEQEFGKLLYETPIPGEFFAWIGGFAIFSFLMTWIREIIKDMEDQLGDREMECRTMPIKWGIPKSKIFVYVLLFITIGLLIIAEKIFIPFGGTFTLRYIIFGIILPIIYLVYLLYKSNSQTDFHQASQLTKFIMFLGVLYSLVFYFLMAKEFHLVLFNIFIIK